MGRSRRPIFELSHHFASVTMQVPEMGDSITEGLISEWVKGVGDFVHVDDVMVIIETDKVAVDVRSQHAGTITKLHSAEGDDVEVGAALVDIEELAEGETPPTPVAQTDVSKPSSTDDAPISVPATASLTAIAANRFEAMKSGHGHHPMIKFKYGKRPVEQAALPAATAPVTVELVMGPIVLGSPLYGRPLLSEMEVNAINEGGIEEYY